MAHNREDYPEDYPDEEQTYGGRKTTTADKRKPEGKMDSMVSKVKKKYGRIGESVLKYIKKAESSDLLQPILRDPKNSPKAILAGAKQRSKPDYDPFADAESQKDDRLNEPMYEPVGMDFSPPHTAPERQGRVSLDAAAEARLDAKKPKGKAPADSKGKKIPAAKTEMSAANKARLEDMRRMGSVKFDPNENAAAIEAASKTAGWNGLDKYEKEYSDKGVDPLGKQRTRTAAVDSTAAAMTPAPAFRTMPGSPPDGVPRTRAGFVDFKSPGPATAAPAPAPLAPALQGSPMQRPSVPVGPQAEPQMPPSGGRGDMSVPPPRSPMQAPAQPPPAASIPSARPGTAMVDSMAANMPPPPKPTMDEIVQRSTVDTLANQSKMSSSAALQMLMSPHMDTMSPEDLLAAYNEVMKTGSEKDKDLLQLNRIPEKLKVMQDFATDPFFNK